MPASGELPRSALAGLGERPFGFYVHVPFCVTRCGYCDFNTYTASELGPGASQRDYADTAVEEVRRARAILGTTPLPVETVFFGGGTPTLLPAGDLVRILTAIEEEFGLAPGAEVSTEANPESVDPAYLAVLRAGGFNRMSFGMQSAREHVLQVLDRRHTPGRAAHAVREARQAGFEHVNLDLIYGTPGESDDDWRASLAAAIEAGPDHVSAYSLIVEDGTRLAARIRRGELPMPDDDVAADRYLIADAMLAEAGFEWYEVSNWATSEAGRCRHNLLYWTGGDWWGGRARGAQPRRRHPLVERQAPRRLRAAPGLGGLPGARARGAGPAGPGGGAADAGAAALPRVPARRAGTSPRGRPGAGRRPAGDRAVQGGTGGAHAARPPAGRRAGPRPHLRPCP
ncbi:hypothetical protein GCM10017559_72630 [Streptosporangium longisporum]|uniref:Heme chaperone HemW n=1 Tax=Streptosporangium longisporum TaxID=46187 RepID=A0ABP6LAW4_9ACTN